MSEAASKPSHAKGLLIALAATVLAAAVTIFAFSPEQAGSPWMALGPLSLYAILTLFAVRRLRQKRELALVLRPKSGDLTIGAVAAGLLYAGAMAGRLLLAPQGSPQEGWVIRVVLHMGDPTDGAIHTLAALVFVTAALEEVAWRSLVMGALGDTLDLKRAWLLTTVLYAVAHLPAAWLLADPMAGLNPAIPGTALAGGFVWGYLALRFERMGPAVFAHAFFSWAMVEFPLWRAVM